MEEKETKKTPKKTTTKKNTTEKKTTTKKATATKSTAAKKTTTKSTTAKKTTATKSTAKKTTATKSTAKKTTTPKKTTTKKTVEKVEVEQNIVEPIIEKEITKEELLERTVIIDSLTKDNLNEVVNNLEEDNIVLKNKVIKRSKVKKIMIIIISVLIATLIIGTAIYAFISTFKDKDELAKSSVDSNILEKVQKQQDLQGEIGEEEKTNYTTGEYYDNIKQMDLRGFENKVLNGENFNAMIFSSTCLACAQFEKTMQPVLEELDVIVYKIDVIQLSDADRAILEDYYSFNITPTLFTVRDGVIKSELVGNHPTDEFKIWAEENLK